MTGVPSSRPRRHVGDIMSREKRSALMSRIRGRNTGPEQALAAGLRCCRPRWDAHAGDLPGCPDFAFRAEHVAVFVDGDFWHGWRFGTWRDKLSRKWEAKIAGNRRRDAKNHRALRRRGWTVVRIWEHQIARDLASCIARVRAALAARRRASRRPGGVRWA
jgi:DNA mismatch endonuclease (patch repair protein)